eukprot:636467-Pyramimonas_sp.AAC.1
MRHAQAATRQPHARHLQMRDASSMITAKNADHFSCGTSFLQRPAPFTGAARFRRAQILARARPVVAPARLRLAGRAG